MNRILILISIIALLFSVSSCKKEDYGQAPEGTSLQGPIIDTTPPPEGHSAPKKKIEFQVVVPPEVKQKWTAVKLVITDKTKGEQKELTVQVGDEFKIEGSALTVKTGAFLPDFKMGGQIITSASSEPANPALGIAVFENNEQIFPASGSWGWIYKNFPTIHPFEHERYGIALKDGVRK